MTLRLSDFDAVTFDVYGTLIDWEPSIAKFLTRWARDNGIEADADTLVMAVGADPILTTSANRILTRG